jgi:hypothetical protein
MPPPSPPSPPSPPPIANGLTDLYGWKLVRRVKAGTQWHPATDRLQGTDVYGTPSSATADETFSVEFGEFDQFLFATGDGAKWLIADKDQVYGTYSNGQRTILRSSISETSYSARWYNRNGYQEDPWIS